MIAFIIIGLLGFMFLVVSAFAGDHDHDVGHDVDHDTGHDGSDGHSPSKFSLQTAAYGMLGFGACGTWASALEWSLNRSIPVAFAGGLALWIIAYYSMKMLYTQQADSTITTSKVIGLTGTVTMDIPPNGSGKISCGGFGEELFACSASDEKLPIGIPIKVVGDAGGGMVIVEPLNKS